MVRLKFIIKCGSLVLRISEGKERYYKKVHSLLIGNPDIKYWDANKERFTYRSKDYVANNAQLERFKDIYKKLITNYPELTARQIASFYKTGNRHQKAVGIGVVLSQRPYRNSVEEYLKVVIEREKSKPGNNFMFYKKLLQRCQKTIPDFSSLTFQAIDFDLCLRMAQMFAKYKNYRGISKGFRALLGKADMDQNVQFSLKQIGGFKFQHYNPEKYMEGIAIPNILNEEKLRIFLNMDINVITPTYRNRKEVELYHDFCKFMFYTFLAPCDVIKLEYRNISNRNTLTLRRKKTCKLTEIPILPPMASLIEKYKSKYKNKYIFPVLSHGLAREYKTRDYLSIRFRENLNKWLKALGNDLELDFNLHSYVFRHTAISTAVNGGLPLAYVAMLAGVKPETIHRYYYYGNSIDNIKKFHRIFTDVAGV